MTSLIIFGMGLLCGAALVAVGWCCFRDVEERRVVSKTERTVHVDRLRSLNDEQTERYLQKQQQLKEIRRLVEQQVLAEFPEWRRGPGGEA